MRPHRRPAHVVTIALALFGVLSLALAPVRPARAAPAVSLDDFRLRSSTVDLAARVHTLDGHLAKLGVENLLDQGNRQATPGCSSPAFKGMPAPPAQAFCFDPEDTGHVGGDADVEWVPQGLTTVADAQQDEHWGTHQALLVSWYDKQKAPEKGIRVSFLDPATNRYQNVLLVYPTADDSYEIVGPPNGIHAGGIVWYGNYLYVADTKRGIRVFDMRYIFDLKNTAHGNLSDPNHVGRHGDTYYGFGYRYVMPQVAAWVNAAGPDSDGDDDCEASGAPEFSYLSLDRSQVPDRLISGEYCRNVSGGAHTPYGRVTRWPLDGSTGTLQTGRTDSLVHATEAYRLPVPNVQGAVSNGSTWYLSRSHSEDNGQLITANAGASGSQLSEAGSRVAAIGPEDLSYWPSRRQVWTVTEHAGERALYGLGV